VTGQASIPVDLFNPGQVIACLGFLEAADVLLGNAEGGFHWSAKETSFVLSADGEENPFAVVLRFLAEAKIVECVPVDYVEAGADDSDDDDDEEESGATVVRAKTSTFPSREGDRNSLPIRLERVDGRAIQVGHWADGSGRKDFKLYSGNRSACRIAASMLQGVRKKPGKKQTIGDLKTRGIQNLWQERSNELIRAPFDVITPMGGSFNFDPRGAWTAIDAGYSPNTQQDSVAASPVVEILAAIGLEHARPDDRKAKRFRYAVWGQPMPPMLARTALAGSDLKVPLRHFGFELSGTKHNKIVTFAEEETSR
jgi:CRISPR-associated protein Csb3